MPRTDWPRFDSPRHRLRRAAAGLCVLGLGSLALLDNLHLSDTPLLRTFWPLVFVVLGGARLLWRQHLAGRAFGAVLIGVGVLMTAHNLGHGTLDLRQWWPVFVILAGVAMLLRGLLPGPRRGWRQRFESSTLDSADVVSIDASFSGLKLRNTSSQFQGGKIDVSFGGLELDLREAVMAGPEATLTIQSTFSGIELRVPRNWQVVVQMSASIGAVEDRSQPPAVATGEAHRLILRGEARFGGVEIKN